MPQELYILAVLDGLSYAALLFLVALGMTLVFGVMNLASPPVQIWVARSTMVDLPEPDPL